MEKLKVGVLTFHRCINYGSYWQAKNLVEGLRAKGHDAVILDHHSRRINIAEWKCACEPMLPRRVPSDDQQQYRYKIRRFFQAFDSLPLSLPFDIQRPEQMPGVDIVVVGSDEVWNLFHPWYGKCSMFYGEGITEKKLVAYAASFGNYPAAWGLTERHQSLLGKFASISVRDKNSARLITKSTDMEPEIVLDPCLQFESNAGKKNHTQEKYALVYGHSFGNQFISRAKKWAASRNIRLLSVGYGHDWVDSNFIEADPHDFAELMQHCSAVVTNFFHGCVFAVRNQKPFVCESSPYRMQKIEGLLHKLDACEYLVDDTMHQQTFDDLLNVALKPGIYEHLRKLRTQSDRFLNKALNIKSGVYEYAEC